MGKKILIILSILVLVMVAVGVPVGIYLLGQRQEIRPEAAPATTLSLKPGPSANTEVSPGEEFDIKVMIDTAENLVVSADVTVTFEADLLEVVSVEKGLFMDNSVKAGERGAGTIRFVYYTEPAAQSNGEKVLATINFKVLETADPGIADLEFDDSTGVGGGGDYGDDDRGKDVLVGTNPTRVTIVGEPEPTAKPTVKPTDPPGPTAPPEVTATPVPPGVPTAVPTSVPLPVTADWTMTMGVLLGGGMLVLLGLLGMALL